MDSKTCKQFFKDTKVCLLLPTYNNENTLLQVITDCKEYIESIIVINDGSTDSTSAIISGVSEIENIEYEINKGKGYALREGIKKATEDGFQIAISMDTDGQHFANDLVSFAKTIKKKPRDLYIGSRNLHQENMPKKNTFGNKFSNFWVQLQTGYKLPDTQSGFRSYPLERIGNKKFYCNKYEFEIEILVRSAWSNITLKPVPINVLYQEGDKRISHFRPFMDFVRISLLNFVLTVLAFLWYIPKRFFINLSWTNTKGYLKKELIKTKDSSGKIARSIGFGVFMGIIPIWGFQFASALILAHYLKLNKIIVGIAANISIPPMIPFILYGSLITGQKTLGKSITTKPLETFQSLDTIKNSIFEYLVGSIVLAIAAGIILGLLTWVFVVIKRIIR